jgi:uncharacterized protein (TIRG00374 family)
MEAEVPVRRRWLRWLLSILAGALFLWLASDRLRLWPDELAIEAPLLLVAAIALHIPYAVLRAMRLQYVLDPLVENASKGAQPTIDRRVLYGSGLVSFFILLVLPLKLGELSRPILLTRGEQPGIRMTEAIGAVALERLVDGLLIVGMLFGGLLFARPIMQPDVVDVQTIGAGMLAIFVIGLVVLVVAARDPERWSRFAARVAALAGERAEAFAARVTGRFATTMRAVLDLRRSTRFAAWSIAYWAITVLQLWLVLQAVGLRLGPAEAAAIVAIVGLSIQLPGGPAQAGTFQVGTGVALGLFLDPATVEGPGSSFAAVMYLLQFVGAGVVALPGIWLLARAKRPGSPA